MATETKDTIPDPVDVMEPSNITTICLDSTRDSRISDVNLFIDRAQVTRSYKVNIAAGRTKLRLTYLPNVIDYTSLKVEGRGLAVIEDVTAFKVPKFNKSETSSLLQKLKEKKAKARDTRLRCQETAEVVESYMNKHTMEHVTVPELSESLDVYAKLQERWKGQSTQADQEIESLDQEIATETMQLREVTAEYNRLRTNIVIGVCAKEDTELDIVMTYVVSGASWKAAYDIQVDMQTPGVPVKLTYQATITQNTGEHWANVSLSLQTAQRTFGLGLPSLGPWDISHQEPPTPTGYLNPPIFPLRGRETYEPLILTTRSESLAVYPLRVYPEEFTVPQAMDVTSTGSPNRTIKLPGLLTIPNDEEEYHVKIADLKLEATVSLACVPNSDPRVYPEAEIINFSDYTLSPGLGNVYVDQSFITSINIPAVSPKGNFKCPLGVDPSILVTYYPRERQRKIFRSGFFKKHLEHDFTRRISIYNKKSVTLHGVRITDYIHVSLDADISVTLISPPLVLPSFSTETPESMSSDKGSLSLPRGAELSISEGLRVMWKGADEVGNGIDTVYRDLGKDGAIDWLCDLPAFGRVDLCLRWKVTTSQVKKQIHGL